MESLDYDGRHEYQPPGGAPKPPGDLWAEMEAAGRAGDMYALDIARAKYAAWLTDQGWRDGVHGFETPAEAIR